MVPFASERYGNSQGKLISMRKVSGGNSCNTDTLREVQLRAKFDPEGPPSSFKVHQKTSAFQTYGAFVYKQQPTSRCSSTLPHTIRTF